MFALDMWNVHDTTMNNNPHINNLCEGFFNLKGHRKTFPKLVKMLVLYLKINFNQRYMLFFPRNKVTVVLRLGFLASHMAETLIENLRKTSECDVIFVKQRPPNTPRDLV